MKNKGISSLLRSKNTVFTFKDISLLWRETDTDLVKARINYYVKTSKLYPIRRGIYAKDKNYDKFELANKIYTPSYISMETVLQKEGVVFQHYNKIFVATYLTREIACDEQVYSFKKIKDIVLSNSLGLIKKENYFIASRERAFMDVLYLYKNYHFDNLKAINWEACFTMLPIYDNITLGKKLEDYYHANRE